MDPASIVSKGWGKCILKVRTCVSWLLATGEAQAVPNWLVQVVSHHWCSEEIWVSPIPKELLEQHLVLIRSVLVSWKIWYFDPAESSLRQGQCNQPPPFWWTRPALWGPWRKSIAARKKTCIRIIQGRFFEDVEYSIDNITNQHKGIASPCTNYSVSSQHTDFSESGGHY